MVPPESESDLARLTPEKRERFLEYLSDHANVSLACKEIGHPRATLYLARERDAAFKEAWDDALDVGVAILEKEVRRRALEGCDEPVFYQGIECGVVRKYSDTLAIFLLKAHRPEMYRERHQVEHSGEVRGGVLVVPSTLAPGDWDRVARGEPSSDA